ncbi:hypothetical protein SAMN05446635_4207 [Burkholderia sp. OK233]|nr:hypothetical protein SAMN05446635_4207 [Burkholderia sp. OK233]
MLSGKSHLRVALPFLAPNSRCVQLLAVGCLFVVFVPVFRRSLLRGLQNRPKARRDGLERQSVCYLHYPFCDMLSGAKF